MLSGRAIVSKQDTIIKREDGHLFSRKGGSESASQIPLFEDDPRRDKIRIYSNKSRNRLALKLRNAVGLDWQLLLTYRITPTSSYEYKKHVAALRLRLLRKYPSIHGVWVVEFQKRGTPHFHILVTEEVDSQWLMKAWQEIICDPITTMANCQKVRNPQKMATYLVKQISKKIPECYSDIGRFWAEFGVKNKKTKVEVVNLTRQLFFDFVRFIRRAYKACRRNKGLNMKIPGGGHTGFVAWDTGPAARQYLQNMGLPAAFDPSVEIHLLYKKMPIRHKLPWTQPCRE